MQRKKIVGNLYWTNKGFAYRVNSPEQARTYNRILATVAITLLVAAVGLTLYYLIPIKV